MKAPRFWFAPAGVLARLLVPLGALYAAATARRLRRGAKAAFRAPVPVLCIGNLEAGGAGKTPVAAYLAAALPGAFIVSRGYGGHLQGPVQVDPQKHSAAEVGDEPLLLAQNAPVMVAKNRQAGAQAALAAGAKALILDDGFQDPSLVKDLSLLVVDAARGWGNGHCLPAGPLREKIAEGLRRADFLLSLGPAEAQARFATTYAALPSPPPRLEGALAPLPMGMDWAGARLFAFAGIGAPEKFFATLRGLGADLRGTVALADHQPLSPTLLQRLAHEARGEGAELVTTEKDAMRLPQAWRGRVLVLPVRLTLKEEGLLKARLAALGLGG